MATTGAHWSQETIYIRIGIIQALFPWGARNTATVNLGKQVAWLNCSESDQPSDTI